MPELAPSAPLRWKQRDIVAVAAIGLAFGVFYLGFVQVWLLAQAVIGPLATDAMLGLWTIGATVAACIIRKPFAAFTGEMLAALAEVLTGNPGGVMILLTGAVQGAGSELPFLATRWRRYDALIITLSGLFAAIFSFAYSWVRFDYGSLAPGLLITMFVIRAASCILIGGFGGRWIAGRLSRTGVLDGLAIARAAGN
jgi:energy-coupling factor transport system permease protein